MNKPLMVCLYAGLHGWEEGAVAAGFRCVGYDIVDMCELCNMPRPDNCELILRDVRSGVPHRPTGHWTKPAENGSTKGMGLGSASWQSKDERSPNDPRNFYSKSPKRKMASALIAKIPLPLSSYIARAFLPHP